MATKKLSKITSGYTITSLTKISSSSTTTVKSTRLESKKSGNNTCLVSIDIDNATIENGTISEVTIHYSGRGGGATTLYKRASARTGYIESNGNYAFAGENTSNYHKESLARKNDNPVAFSDTIGAIARSPNGKYRYLLQGMNEIANVYLDWIEFTNISLDITYTPVYNLTVTAGEGGTVTGGGSYQNGATATLTATPTNEYYRFKQWNDGNRDNPRTVTVNSNATYTATFVQMGKVRTLGEDGEGTTTGDGWYEYGSNVKITATPNTGYQFIQWSDGNRDNPRTVTVTTPDALYLAWFEKLIYTLTVTAGEGGTVDGGGEYEHGATATLKATPNTGYRFVKWNDDANAPATRTVTVTGNATYTATFEKLKYTVTWKNHDGTTLETDTNVEYGTTPSYNGATPTKASTAQHAYTFSGWSPTVSAVTGNVTYTAQFTATVRKYTVKWYNYDGTLLETDTDVPYGTKPTYNGATPTKPSDDYYTYGFAGWSPSTEEAIQGDKDFTAQFAQTDRYYTVRWVNASAVQGTEGALLETDTVKFNTQPDYNGATPKHPKQDSDPAFNYDFIGWSAKVTDPAKPDTELEKVKGNITYTAIYETTPKLYAITVILFDSQSTDVYEYGTEVTIEAPEIVDFHRFVKWSDGDTRRSRTITVTGVATYQAVYERTPIPVKINKEQVTGCYIIPTTKTIVYVISGTVPTVETKIESVGGWSFLVSNSVPGNGYPLKKLFITEKNGVTTRIY